MESLTPLMKQYWDIKSAHPDKIVLFRMGDFFEMFHDDATLAAPLLGITLTKRNRKALDETPMCGVPHHSLAGHINKLLSAGNKVAICDQVEDPKISKGLVKRAVTRILSPAMVYDPDTLAHEEPNYLCSFDEESLSFLDSTTGEAFYFEVSEWEMREKLISVLKPKEIVLSESQKEIWILKESHEKYHITYFDRLKQSGELPVSSQRLLSYAVSMQGEEILNTLLSFEKRPLLHKMDISQTVLRHLEIFETYSGQKMGSLYEAINRTKTSGGARQLREWLSFPLWDLALIEERLDHVQFWQEKMDSLSEIRKELGGLGDLERKLGKVAHPQCGPKDIKSLQDSLEVVLRISKLSPSWKWPSSGLFEAQKLIEIIEERLLEDPPTDSRQGGFIRKGFNLELDQLIDLTSNVQSALMQMELKEREQTGISSLKIKYNQVFGYYIEVTHAHQSKVPSHYQRKQTLTQSERYMTKELSELESKILSAHTQRTELEYELFVALKSTLLEVAREILLLAKGVSELDVITSFAWLAIEQNYTRPTFGENLKIVASRHPVVEQKIKAHFIANDIELGLHHCALITGPNMAGKSTLMRQVALTLMMAQMGSFVPAQKADLLLVDRIFTRIGSSDSLTEGLSTFMVEMKETAALLSQATSKSFIILDEIGRGTSTYDGLSIAQALMEYIVTKVKSTMMFATHYHELTQLSQRYPTIINWHMTILEKSGGISFLHTLAHGPAHRSYGIQVAKLAGLPLEMIQRAAIILNQLEKGKKESKQQLTLFDFQHHHGLQEETSKGPSFSHFDANSEQKEFEKKALSYETFLKKIREYHIQSSTPLEALNQISKWQEELEPI